MPLKDRAGNVQDPLVFDREIPDYGVLMTKEKWLGYVRNHSFIDYDGTGSPSNGKMLSRTIVYPSIADQLPEEATHVMWFNR